MVQAASLNVNLTAGVAGFEAGMKRATNILGQFSKAAAKLETAFVGAAVAVKGAAFAMAKQFADAGSEVFDLSKKTGASTEALSALGYAGKLSGVALSDLGGALAKMNKNLAENEKNFKVLGLDLNRLKSMSTEDQFIVIADAISKIPDQATKTSLAMGIFGKSATNLFPLIDGGAETLRNATKEARTMGVVMSAEAAAKADDLGDSFDRVSMTASALTKTIGEALAPSYTRFNNTLADTIAAITQWIKNSPQAIDLTLKISTAFGVLAISIFSVRRAMGLVTSVFVVATPIFKAITWAVLGLATAIQVTLALAVRTAMKAIGAWLLGGTGGFMAAIRVMIQGLRLLALAFLSLSPAGIVTAVATSTAAFLAFTKSGNQLVSWIYDKLGGAFEWMVQKLSKLLDKLGETGQGIKQLIGMGGGIPQPERSAPADQAFVQRTQQGFADLWKNATGDFGGIGLKLATALEKARKTEEEAAKDRKRPNQGMFDNIGSFPQRLGEQLQTVAGIGGNALFQALAKNIQGFREGQTTPVALNAQGPELIQAGTAAAFGLGKNNPQEKTQNNIEKNTKGTYEEIKSVAAQLAAGLKVNIRNIEAFAP